MTGKQDGFLGNNIKKWQKQEKCIFFSVFFAEQLGIIFWLIFNEKMRIWAGLHRKCEAERIIKIVKSRNEGFAVRGGREQWNTGIPFSGNYPCWVRWDSPWWCHFSCAFWEAIGWIRDFMSGAGFICPDFSLASVVLLRQHIRSISPLWRKQIEKKKKDAHLITGIIDKHTEKPA